MEHFPSWLLSLLFAGMIMLNTALRLWLNARQVRHVAQHRQAVPQAFATRIDLAAHQKAADYTIAKSRIAMVDIGGGALILVVWTLLGGLDWLNQALMTWLGGGMWQQLALLASFMLINAVVEIPLSLYQTFVVEARFGFNKTTPALWFSDMLKGALLGALLGLPLGAAVLWLMGSTGAWWWLWVWALWMSFSLLMMVIYPSFIAPWFNQFKPLEDEALKTRVHDLMQRCGFTAKGFFVMDGSRRSAHANAYFTGLGSSKRVVFFDTLLAQLNADEVQAVLAHELGHFKHRHIVKRMITLFVFSLLGLGLLGWLSTQTWFYTGLGVTPSLNAPHDALALLLFSMALPVVSFFLTPFMAARSRRDEFEADAYAATHSKAEDLSSALLKLYQDNASTLTPDPLFVSFYYSHPPAAQRLQRLQMPAPANV